MTKDEGSMAKWRIRVEADIQDLIGKLEEVAAYVETASSDDGLAQAITSYGELTTDDVELSTFYEGSVVKVHAIPRGNLKRMFALWDGRSA